MNQAARAYGNRVSSRNPTKGSFGAKKIVTTKTSLPFKKAEPEPTTEQKSPPTYGFVDSQKGDTDTKAEAKGAEDDEMRKKMGKAPSSEEQASTSFKPPTHKVEKSTKDDQPSTVTSMSAAGDEFERYWTLEHSYDIQEETYSETNEWTPNALALFEILDQTGSFVYNSRIVNKHHPEYLDYAVACYYSMLFYIQILRAREAATQLTGMENSFLKRFRKAFNEEELPIAGPLFPYFNSIVSTLLPDSKYNWIVPRIAPEMFRTNMSDYTDEHGSVFMQPMFPHMIATLRYAISKQMDKKYFDMEDEDYANFIDYEKFVPTKFTDAESRSIYGIEFQTGDGNAPRNHNKYSIFASSGLSYPFYATPEQLDGANRRWRNTNFFKGMKASVRAGHTSEALKVGADVRINDIDNFLLSPKSESLDWFRELINQAAIHARFFDQVKNLSDVPTDGGNETLVIATLKAAKTDNRFDGATPPVRKTFADTHLRFSATHFNWYPTTFKNLYAEFHTTRNGIMRNEVFQAITFAVNANLPITDGTSRVGTSKGSAQVSGKYFDNTEWTATMYDDADVGKPMFRGWTTMHQSRSVKIKPEGY